MTPLVSFISKLIFGKSPPTRTHLMIEHKNVKQIRESMLVQTAQSAIMFCCKSDLSPDLRAAARCKAKGSKMFSDLLPM